MNIGIVTTWFERGAAYVSRQYRDVLSNEHNVFIYARGGEARGRGDPHWDGPDVFWGRRTWSMESTHMDLGEFRRWLTQNKIELVLFNEQRWWPPVWMCREMGIRTAAYVDYYTEKTIPMFGAYDLLLCNTRRHAEAFEWHPQCQYIPWGTDVDLFRPQEGAHVQGTGAPVFFHSAGMDPRRKGTLYLLRAFSKLAPPARLLIHTQVDIARKCFETHDLIAQLRQRGMIEIAYKTVAAPGLYHRGDVYVYPALLEGIGLSVPEALACGLPAIVPDNPPMNEFVQDGVSGSLVRVERLTARSDGYYWPKCHVSIDALAGAMQDYVDRFDTLAGEKHKARAWAEKKLDWATNARELGAILQETQPIERALFEKSRRNGLQLDRVKHQRFFLYARMRWKWPLLNALDMKIRRRGR
jgi:1,2-diacylglycerol 3-alpha-glucosyltransferase